MRVYLDTCCLNRPFDDQSQERIRSETDAVRLVLADIERSATEWVISEVVTYEVDRISDIDRRESIEEWLRLASSTVWLDETTIQRAEHLHALGLHRYDALHVVCAEAGGADVMLTTDDHLLRLARRLRDQIGLMIENPKAWIAEGPK